MANYGVLPTGFLRMRYPEILDEVLAALKAGVGQDFDSDPQSVTGQIIKVFCERTAADWELAQAVYNAMYPSSATGEALRDAIAFVGAVAQPAARTLVPAILYGTVGTSVPANSIVRSTQGSGNYLLDAITQIAFTNAVIVDFTITVTNSSAYTVTINGVGATFTSDASATLSEIQAGLISALATSAPTLSVSSISGGIRISDPTLKPFTISFTGQFAYTSLGSYGLFYREDVGPEYPANNTLTSIVSTVNGWATVNNPIDATVGRLEETDAEIRQNYNLGVFRTATHSPEGIRANLLEEVKGITYARVYQNKTNSTDADSRPAHTVEAVVSGGLTNQILASLYRNVAGGIDTYGAVTGAVVDSQGVSHTMRFTRPTPVLAWLKVSVTKYPEEVLPDSATADLIAEAVRVGNTFGVGTDIIPQRFMGPFYSKVPGVKDFAITIATGSSPAPGDYVSTPIAIGLREYSAWDTSRITVTIIP